jgi:hypothetical protein
LYWSREYPRAWYFTAYQSWYLTPWCGLEGQKPTQALKSVKGSGNTFDLSPKLARTLPSLIYFSWNIYRDPLSTKNNSNIKVHISHLWLKPQVSKNFASVIYCSWDIYRDPLQKNVFKYQSWYLTPCCGLEVQKPTQALMSVKGPGNTLDINPKWGRTLPFFIYFWWDINRDPPPQNIFSNIKVDFLHPAVGLRYRKPPRHLSQLKAQEIPFDLNSKWARTLPSLIYFLWDIYRDPPSIC